MAGTSTLNGLEHAPEAGDRYQRIAHDPAAIEDVSVDLFLNDHNAAPECSALDLDATDEPLLGRQEGTRDSSS